MDRARRVGVETINSGSSSILVPKLDLVVSKWTIVFLLINSSVYWFTLLLNIKHRHLSKKMFIDLYECYYNFSFNKAGNYLSFY